MMIRSPLFNFLLGTAAGIVFGGCLATSIAVHTITNRVEARNRAATASNIERIQRIDRNWREAMAGGCPPPAELR